MSKLNGVKFLGCAMLAVAVLVSCLLSNYMMPKVNAEDASISVAVDRNKVNVGDAFNVTVTYSSEIDSGFLKWTLSYNDSLVSYSGGAGKIPETFMFENQTDNTKNVTKSYTFTAKSVGKADFTIEAESVKMDPVEYMTIKKSGATISVEDVGSNDATLSKLSISSGELSPQFSPTVTEYSVTVPFEVNTLYVYATENDKRASHEIEGSEFLEIGTKQRVVVVTAQDGTVKKYTIKITRLPKATAKPTETPSAKPTVSPSGEQTAKPTETVTPSATPDNSGDIIINNIKYEITISYNAIVLPEGFEKSKLEIGGKEYTSLEGISKDMVLLPLTDGEETSLFVYDEEKSLFYPYSEVSVKSGTYSILTLNGDKPSFSYPKTEIEFNGAKADAYKIGDENEDFYIVKALNWDGEENYYCYDKKENTMQRYVSVKVDNIVAEEDKPTNTATPVTSTSSPKVDNNEKKSSNFDKNSAIMVAVACVIFVVFAVLILVLILKERKLSKLENE